jgi:hypothetical protein
MDGVPFYKANTIFFWPDPAFFRLPPTYFSVSPIFFAYLQLFRTPTYFSYASAAGVRHIARIEFKGNSLSLPKGFWKSDSIYTQYMDFNSVV